MVKIARTVQFAGRPAIEIIDRPEPVKGGGWRLMERVFIKEESIINGRCVVCPNCGNDDENKFELITGGTAMGSRVVEGLVCISCGLPK